MTGIIKNDGILKMWTGLGAGILRQCSYTTVRLGVYRKLEEKYHPKTFGEKLALGKTIFKDGIFSSEIHGAIIC